MDALTELAQGPLAWLPPLLAAPFIGSFAGVLIQRLPDDRPVALARSQCDRCGHKLAPLDLIPLLSYALLRGRCRYCGAAIGWFPPAVELAALGVAAWAVFTVPAAAVWLSCLLGWTLLTASWIDARTMLLPDVLTLPLLLAGLGATAWLDPGSLPDHALAAALGYGVLFAIARCYRWLRGRDGMGLGDAKLLGALGAWLGLSDLPTVVLLAACMGLAAAGALVLRGRRITGMTAIPFGPFLAVSGWLVWLYG